MCSNQGEESKSSVLKTWHSEIEAITLRESQNAAGSSFSLGFAV